MKSFKPNRKIKDIAYVDSIEKYNETYDYSINNPEGFWTEQAERGAPSREGRCWSSRPVAWEVVGIFKCSGWVRKRARYFISYRFDH